MPSPPSQPSPAAAPNAATPPAPELMTTREVAAYLRIKERTVYELVREGRIPCTRVTGKWLFPKQLIDRWVVENTGSAGGEGARRPAPPIIAGSHDPLLDWAIAESQCGLALLPGGSLDGLARLAAGGAVACGIHLRPNPAGEYNVAAVGEKLAGQDVVAIQWAWREQGLILAQGNPLGIRGLADLKRPGVRVARRQDEAGSWLLFRDLLGRAGIAPDELCLLPDVARNEADLALAVLEGRADVGLGVAAAARPLKLDFLPLERERFDLVVRRRDYFEPPFQRLLAFARTERFRRRAAELGGYDVEALGTVVYNGP